MTLFITANELRTTMAVGASTSDEALERVSAAAQSAFLIYLKKKDDAGDDIDYSDVPEVLEGISNLAIEYFGASRAPGGQSTGIDMAPTPRVSASIVRRCVQSYALQHMDAGSFFA